MNRNHISQRAPEPVGPYPHAKRVGDFIFVSGIGPRQHGKKEIPGLVLDDDGRAKSHDIRIQTKATIENIKMILEEMGSGLEDIVDCTCFLTDMRADFKDFNEIYGDYLEKIGPTRTTVEVTRLPTPIAVELKVIAYTKK
jgi:2-aminomuconate deaminase